MQLKIVKDWKEICSCNENAMSKYRSFYNFNPCNLFLKQDKSCLLKEMMNYHHPSIEINYIELFEYRCTKNMMQF